MSEAAALQTQRTKAPPKNSYSLLVQRKCACGGSAGLTGSCTECERKKLLGQPLQTKLRISEPGDEYEQEADRVAEQVMRMAEPTRETDTSTMPLLQRKVASGSASSGTAPAIVYDVLSSPGQPLDGATRAFFEPRFGHDLGRVRVHTDTKAAESARAVNALAYTVGNDIVFGDRAFSSGSDRNESLLAHELTHVIQQTGAKFIPQSGTEVNDPETYSRHLLNVKPESAFVGQSSDQSISECRTKVQRKKSPPIDVAVFPRMTVLGDTCTEQQKKQIKGAYENARRWIDRSIVRLHAVTSGLFPFSTLVEPGQAALERHFKTTDQGTANAVVLRLEQIRGNVPTETEFKAAGSPQQGQNIVTESGTQVPITTRYLACGKSGGICKGTTGAYTRSDGAVVFCPTFFARDLTAKTGYLVHELAHTLDSGGSILDFAYGKDRLYPDLTTAEALLNADSYANLVEELATGKVSRMTAPKDTLGKCPDDWVPLVHSAIARAHQWARVAAKLYSGPSNDPLLAYQKVKDGLEKPVRIGCRASGARACNAGTLWFHGAGDKALYLCPAWRALPDDEPRAVSMLAGLIGYFDGPGHAIDWEKYALDASALTRSKLYPSAPSPAPSTGHP